MKRLGDMLKPTFMALGIIGALAWPGPAGAVPPLQTSTDYAANPPFVADVVKPNVLLEFDNSGSMGFRAVCDNTDNATVSGYNVTSIASGGTNIAKVTTTSSNRMLDGMWMTVRGVTGPTVGDAALYNGDFPVNAPPLFDLYDYFFQVDTSGGPTNNRIVVFGTVADNILTVSANPAVAVTYGGGVAHLADGASAVHPCPTCAYLNSTGGATVYDFQTNQQITIQNFNNGAVATAFPALCFTGLPGNQGGVGACYASFNGTFTITVLDAYTFYYVINIPGVPPPPPPPGPPPPPPAPPVTDGGGILGIFPKAWAAYESPRENTHSVWRAALGFSSLMGTDEANAFAVGYAGAGGCAGGAWDGLTNTKLQNLTGVAGTCELPPINPVGPPQGTIQLFPTTFNYTMAGIPSGAATSCAGCMSAYSVVNLTISNPARNGGTNVAGQAGLVAVGSTATVVTNGNHGYHVGELVTVFGADGSGNNCNGFGPATGVGAVCTAASSGTSATDDAQRFNGTFIITDIGCSSGAGMVPLGTGSCVPPSNATATATVDLAAGTVTGITVTDAGFYYIGAPAVTISFGGYTTIAQATAVIDPVTHSVSAINLSGPNFGGAGYTSVPSVTLTGGFASINAFKYKMTGPISGGMTEATSSLKRIAVAAPYNACPTQTSLYPLTAVAWPAYDFAAGVNMAQIAQPQPGAFFMESITYSGIFDPKSCYTYDNGNNRFTATATVKATVNTACGATEWDGNFLDWASTRRHDVLKISLIGAQCAAVARAADGTCPLSGAPGLITMKGEDGVFVAGAANGSSFPVLLNGCGSGGPGSECGDNQANGRVPAAVQQLVGATPPGVSQNAQVGQPVVSLPATLPTGSNYTSPPSVTINCIAPCAGGSGATATATVGSGTIPIGTYTVAAGPVTITAPGANYTSAPNVTFTLGGGAPQAIATATIDKQVTALALTNRGTNYSGAPPTVTLTGGGFTTQATAVANMCVGINNPVAGCQVGKVASLGITSGGSGYTAVPVVTFTCGGACVHGAGALATGTATIKGIVTAINVTSAGSGYTSNPTITINGGGGAGATAVASINGKVTALTVTNGGSNYPSCNDTTGVPTTCVLAGVTAIFSGGGGGSGASAGVIVGGACGAACSTFYSITGDAPAIVGAQQGQITGNVQGGGGIAMVTHLEGVNTGGAGGIVSGGLCVGRFEVANPSIANKATCGIMASGSANGQFRLHVGVPTEPTGLIQQLGDQARFGLLEFRANSGANDGGKVVVPIGSFHSSTYSTNTVSAWNSNKVAMIAGIEQANPAVSTPLAETLYTGIRYIAQLPQPFGTDLGVNYLYPIAFAPSGPAYNTATRAGTLGKPAAGSELLALKAGENCNLPLAAGYIANACGRDPYYFGANQSWTDASKQVPCCRTFIMILTDGEPTADNNIPVVLQDYAHAVHGAHCVGLTNKWTPSLYTPGNPPGGTAPVGDYPLTANPPGNPADQVGPYSGNCYDGSQTDSSDPVSLIPTGPSPTKYPALSSDGKISPAQEASILLQQHKQDYPLPYTFLNHTLDDVAYWAHTTDLRPETAGDDAVGGACTTTPLGTPSAGTVAVILEAGHPLCGFQNVTIYSFFAFGNIAGREILMQTARQGGFEDQNKDGLGPNGTNTPDLQVEWDAVDNFTGLPVPDGIPDNYFESQNAQDLKDKLLAAITSILQKAASGTSVSVLATSSTGEGAIYQAFFFPKTFVDTGSGLQEVDWTGFAQSLFIDKFGNLREDYSQPGCLGPPDGLLTLKHDCIVKIRLETNPVSPNFGFVVFDRFKDDGTFAGSTAADGIADSCPDATLPSCVPFATSLLSDHGVNKLQPLWEGGRRLALLPSGASCESSNTWPKGGNLSESGNNCRRILTWMDLNNNGLNKVGGVNGANDVGETVEFSTANVAALCPYLGGAAVKYCTDSNAVLIDAPAVAADPGLTGCIGLTRQTCATNEATGIINFVRGCDPAVCPEQALLRSRLMNVINDSGTQVQMVWKLGDVVNSTPVVVGAPSERFDIIYGDASYSSFFQRYKDRRQVAYVGANDGMMHAFNAGFFQQGDVTGSADPVQVRFTLSPKLPASTTNCSGLPCDASVAQYTFRGDEPPLGAELWAYVPHDLLPQLRWLTSFTSGKYNHVYYVDLKPKITDVRIFAADADHPGGWGTILIGGFRLGGSCSNCKNGNDPPRLVNADFDGNGDILGTNNAGAAGSASDFRVFLSSYFVLDITNPEKEPTLLWTLRDQRLGLTTAYPAVLRVKGANAAGENNTGATGEKWYAIFGTGPTHKDGIANELQTAQTFAVDLQAGPVYSNVNRTAGVVNGQTCLTTVDTTLGVPQLGPCLTADTGVGSGQVRVFNTQKVGSFMSDAITVDFQLDYRVDTVYSGSVTCNVIPAHAPGGAPGTPQTWYPCSGPDPVPGPIWRGGMWRLATDTAQPFGFNTNPDNWGIAAGAAPCVGAGSRCPTALLSGFAAGATAGDCLFTVSALLPAGHSGSTPNCLTGPVVSAPSVAGDDQHNLWVYFGTGRFYNINDKTNTDIQHFFGVKDDFISAGTNGQTIERNNLFNSSHVVTCSSCAASSNVSQTGSTTTFDTGFGPGAGSLLNNVQNMDGWFTIFNDPTAPFQTPPGAVTHPGERNLNPAIVVGGTLFFTTFTPSPDICVATGTGLLYSVFYQTGGAFTGSAIGTTGVGGNTLVNKSISLGQGMPSQAAVQIGAQGSGASGTSSSSGCAGRTTVYIQASTGVLGQTCGSTALQSWSRMVSWRDM